MGTKDRIQYIYCLYTIVSLLNIIQINSYLFMQLAENRVATQSATNTITMLLQVRNTFPSIQAAKDTIKTALAKAQESRKTTHSNKTRFNIICKDTTCHFCIQVA